MDWRGNQLTGTIPKEFTELTSLIFWSESRLQAIGHRCPVGRSWRAGELLERRGARPLTATFPLPSLLQDLDNNRLSGQLPSSFQFDRSAPTTGIGIGGNNFSGLVPSWPDFPSAVVAISPGNEGLCGPLPPAGPQLIGDGAEVESLPPCPGQSDGSGLSAGAIAGIVVGCVAAASRTLRAVCGRHSVSGWLQGGSGAGPSKLWPFLIRARTPMTRCAQLLWWAQRCSCGGAASGLPQLMPSRRASAAERRLPMAPR